MENHHSQGNSRPGLPRKKNLQTILVKPAGPDCNMACTYCFYLKKKALFHGPPLHRMSEKILEELIRQGMHQAGRQVNFTWQGGEPLLMGLPFFRKAIEFQMRYGAGQVVGNGLQTNGLLIDDEWVDFLRSYHWLVGVSLDGPRHVHDRYRRTAGGGSSWETVVKNAEKMLGAGVAVNALTVVTDYSVRFAGEIYAFHKDLGLNHMQFIPCVEIGTSGMHPASVPPADYGSFLCSLFDLWTGHFSNGLPTTSVRFFDSLFHGYVGLEPPECSLYKECGTYVVVEHNGDVYACDFFVEPGWRLGNLGDRAIIDLLNGDRQAAFGRQKTHLPDACGPCQWLRQCRGGCTKDRLTGPGGATTHYLCDAFKTFFEYSDQRFRKLAKIWQDRRDSVNRAHTKNVRQKPGGKKVGRNAPCPCGSGRKFKKCCGSQLFTKSLT